MKKQYPIFLNVSRMKLRNIFLCLCICLQALAFSIPSHATEVTPETIAPGELHALSATLLDGETGRVLYDKEGTVQRANASTTKILTCILALESCEEEEVVTVSAYAASMPNVQLGIEEGETYYLRDLLYSLMLESHNDSAVAIAEHVAGSVEEFALRMNEKAAALGCETTHFITPNGLDATDEEGMHGTTSQDLAKIMAYCAWDSPKSQRFLEVTETANHSFSNLVQQADGTYTAGNRSFSCDNKNAYLEQNAECITGKTGYTSEAGYCYVSAVVSQGRKFVVALLASGWPSNKNYKWQDCNTLYTYGTTYYHLRELPELSADLQEITVLDSANSRWDLEFTETAMPYVSEHAENLLMADWEEISIHRSYPKEVTAGKKGEQTIGTLEVTLGEQTLFQENIYVNLPNNKRDLPWYFQSILSLWTSFSYKTL
jgi:D-alanyl-D-alanine carboxypeptidase (penicillin-binding protein 5/6)